MLSHRPSGAGGRARLAASAGSPREPAGGRGRRRQRRLGAGLAGRARPSPLPRPPLRCRPSGRSRLQLTGLESRLEAPRPPLLARAPARRCRRPASRPRPRHGRRRQRAQQGAQPAAALPLRLLGVSGALGREGAGLWGARRRGPGAGPGLGAALGGERWPRRRSRAGEAAAAAPALGLRCSTPAAGRGGPHGLGLPWAQAGQARPPPRARASADAVAGAERCALGLRLRGGAAQGDASRAGVGAAGPPAVPRAGRRLRAGQGARGEKMVLLSPCGVGGVALDEVLAFG